MSVEIKDLQAEMQKTFGEMKNMIERQNDEIKKYGEPTAETKATMDKINDRLDELESKLNRTPFGGGQGGNGGGQADTEAKNAFLGYVRKGMDRMTQNEIKALATDSDTEGGFLVPTTMRNRIIEKVLLLSPFRSLAAVETISIGDALQIPVEVGLFDAGWTSERAARPETASGTFGMETIPTHEQYAKPKATQKMLDDTAFDVEGWIERKISERFAVLEGQAFITGDGQGKPEGFLAKSGVGEVVSGNATQITADGLVNLYYDLREEYARSATWVMKRQTIREIRKLKDLEGRYLWEPELVQGQPATILGRPYSEMVDMPDIAAGAYAVAFGDWKQAYQIVDRQGIRSLRDPYSSKPFIEFYTTRRVGGQVVKPEAFRKLKISN